MKEKLKGQSQSRKSWQIRSFTFDTEESFKRTVTEERYTYVCILTHHTNIPINIISIIQKLTVDLQPKFFFMLRTTFFVKIGTDE